MGHLWSLQGHFKVVRGHIGHATLFVVQRIIQPIVMPKFMELSKETTKLASFLWSNHLKLKSL